MDCARTLECYQTDGYLNSVHVCRGILETQPSVTSESRKKNRVRYTEARRVRRPFKLRQLPNRTAMLQGIVERAAGRPLTRVLKLVLSGFLLFPHATL
jgi:hypothetical protein